MLENAVDGTTTALKVIENAVRWAGTGNGVKCEFGHAEPIEDVAKKK